MAVKSTIFKADLTIADSNRGYYDDHALTIARHPSETNQRMILRLAVFALNAHENLQFTKGLSEMDEPDMWQKSLMGDIEHWIELGQPLDKRIRQSCGKSTLVSIYTYQRGSAQNWFEGIEDSVDRFKHLRVIHLTCTDEAAIDRLVDRSMKLTCMIDEQQIMLTNDKDSLTVELKVLKDFCL
jgi:uncharacterized protein YaeQ